MGASLLQILRKEEPETSLGLAAGIDSQKNARSPELTHAILLRQSAHRRRAPLLPRDSMRLPGSCAPVQFANPFKEAEIKEALFIL